jgi:16S rRNA C967 or C1407 C5-methylase (RsmB/RsmF family)
MIVLDPWGKAIVYATFSKNKSENDDVVQALIDEQTEQRSQSIQKKEAGIYRYDLT